MTMGHRTDRPILEEIFRQGRRPAYLGVIGSEAKRKVMVRELTEAGIAHEAAEQFRCPIGLPHRPEPAGRNRDQRRGGADPSPRCSRSPRPLNA